MKTNLLLASMVLFLTSGTICAPSGWATTMSTTENTAKAVLSGSTLTFYYDSSNHSEGNKYSLNTGENEPSWPKSGITTVVFDASFAEARPTTTYRWFYNCASLTKIKGMENLNTSEVTIMQSMFDGCESLTTLTFSSNFTTEKVTDMSGMFFNCHNLRAP